MNEQSDFKPYRPNEPAIPIDFQSEDTPQSVKKLQPHIFKDGPDSYCCIIDDPYKGIWGCGTTPLEAMKEFDKEYHRKLTEGKLADNLMHDHK